MMGNKCGHKARLGVFSFGFGIGIAEAIYFVLFAWSGWLFGYGVSMIDSLSGLMYGYAPSFIGGVIGGLWGFVDGFIFGLIAAFVYNLCVSCCCKKTADSTADASEAK